MLASRLFRPLVCALCATTIHVKTTSKVKITAPQVRIVTASPREQELSKHMVARTGTELLGTSLAMSLTYGLTYECKKRTSSKRRRWVLTTHKTVIGFVSQKKNDISAFRSTVQAVSACFL